MCKYNRHVPVDRLCAGEKRICREPLPRWKPYRSVHKVHEARKRRHFALQQAETFKRYMSHSLFYPKQPINARPEHPRSPRSTLPSRAYPATETYNTTTYKAARIKLSFLAYVGLLVCGVFPTFSQAETEVLVLKHEMRQGDILSAQDLEWETAPSVPAGAVQNPLDIIGKSAKNHLKSGLVMYSNLFELPKLILQGQTVEVLFRSGSLDIRYTGVATQDGSKGQLITIRMPSGTLIGATVLEAGRVLVP
jgi:flagella basal body P-ring formation protein FlgA